MARKSPHSRAIARIAKMLVEQGHDMMDNGQELQDMHDDSDNEYNEGRLRILAGMVIADVGQCIMLDARSEVMRREFASLERRIRQVVRQEAM